MAPLRPTNAGPPALRSWLGIFRLPAHVPPLSSAYSPQFRLVYLGIGRSQAGGVGAESWIRIALDQGIASLYSERLGGSRPLAEEAQPVPGLVLVNPDLEGGRIIGDLDPLARAVPTTFVGRSVGATSSRNSPRSQLPDRGEAHFGQGENSWKTNSCT
jgi:hypothetical protein